MYSKLTSRSTLRRPYPCWTNYFTQCGEWYGWHVPKLGKIITDNIAFVRTVDLMGTRDNTKSTDFSGILPDEVGRK